ncbi:MAG: hypothetical protein IPL61_13015 [Myxococcales bacterium]|nr:hypothetical protein [Myxococcales bacterium]
MPAANDDRTDEGPPPSKEELIARLEALKGRTEDLLDRARAHARPSPAVIILRVFMLFGLPILVAIGVYLATRSVLFALLALVGALIAAIAIALKLSPTPAHMKPGTRSWEAQMTLPALRAVIASRLAERGGGADPAKRRRLDREIAFLTDQRDELERVAASNDGSPGKGYVGFKPYNGA